MSFNTVSEKKQRKAVLAYNSVKQFNSAVLYSKWSSVLLLGQGINHNRRGVHQVSRISETFISISLTLKSIKWILQAPSAKLLKCPWNIGKNEGLWFLECRISLLAQDAKAQTMSSEWSCVYTSLGCWCGVLKRVLGRVVEADLCLSWLFAAQNKTEAERGKKNFMVCEMGIFAVTISAMCYIRIKNSFLFWSHSPYYRTFFSGDSVYSKSHLKWLPVATWNNRTEATGCHQVAVLQKGHFFPQWIWVISSHLIT